VSPDWTTAPQTRQERNRARYVAVGHEQQTVMERTMQHDERSPSTDIQPDPQLQLSEGRASAWQIAVVALACVAVIGVTIYGLGRPATTDGSVTASAPSQETTGAAPPAEPAAPQTGGNVAGGDNIAPKGEAAQPQDQPAQEPVPQQTKPGAVESDSGR
jgi:hypothetical protein